MGQSLLDRSSRSIVPTAAGAAILPHARAALTAAQQVSHTVDEFTGLLRGHVRIGLVSGAATDEFDVTRVLTGFHRDHPQVAISLTEDTSDRMLAAVVRGDLDIALVGLTGAELDPSLGIDIVLDTRINAVVAIANTEFDDRTTLSALRDHPLICLTRGTGIRGVLERACAAAGFTPRIEFEAAAPPLLTRLASGGLGIAIVPDLPPAQAAAAGVRTVEIIDPELHGRLALAWRTDHPASPATKVLLGQLRIAFAPPHPTPSAGATAS